ncbi:hypothetical protein A7Q10_02290 [Methylacidiphilum caldifontis]|uniref:Uncharacterized protein n=2 Tax=Methylacidiphilum caldifontis TaxID=2795386 RepID=A0A4Y8P797_9BACT|nr:hypothetical protein A7Q10_02290 [Methylacidiphilum caldifontis]
MDKKMIYHLKDNDTLRTEEKEEKDLSKIVFPEDLSLNHNDYGPEDQSFSLSYRSLLFEAYFYQRLGKDLPRSADNEPAFPAIIVERDFFLSLIEGDYPLWAQMYDEAPEAWEEWFVIDNPKKPGSIMLSMPIEEKEIGIHSIKFIQKCDHPLKEELLDCCKKLQESCVLLHSSWEKRDFRFVSFERLPKDFTNKRFRLEAIKKQYSTYKNP